MGFITTINKDTGRDVYACEVGAEGCTSYPCRAHKCPAGWCQRYYICESCWSKESVKVALKNSHATCAGRSRQFEEREEERTKLLKEGKFLRTAALRSANGERVHVLFVNSEGVKKGFYMDPEVYRSIPFLENSTVEDYAAAGRLVEAPESFYGRG